MTRHLRPLVLVVVLALGLTACGDDSIADLPDGAGDVPGGVGDLPGDLGDLPGVGDVPGVGDLPGISDECEAFFNLSLAMSAAFSGGFQGLESDIVANLPAAARADGEVVAAALREFSERLDAAGIDLTAGITEMSQEQMQQLGEIGSEVFDQEVDAAFDRIGDVAEANCASSFEE